MPRNSAPTGDRRNADEGRAEAEERPDARRVAGHVEAAPPPNERDEQEQRDRRLLEVETLREVRGGRGDDDRHRELPGTPPAPRERAREPDQADPEGDGEDARGLRPPGGRTPPTIWRRSRHLRRQRRDDADHAHDRGAPGQKPLGTRATQRHAARVQRAHEGTGRAFIEEELEGTVRIRPARWVTLLLGLVAIGLVPWTLYLTFTLPSRHVTLHYDLAWVGFDVALACAFAATTLAALRRSHWLVPLAAVTGTMLVCDAWFDVVTSHRGGEMWEAIAEAVFAELPLAALCAFIVYDAETFLAATVNRFRR